MTRTAIPKFGAMLALVFPAIAIAQDKPPCRDNAAEVVINIAGARLDRMERNAMHYRFNGGTIIAACDFAVPTDVGSFTVSGSAKSADYRRAVEIVLPRHTGEPAQSGVKLIDRCLARASAARRPFQVVGSRATVVCGNNPLDVAIYRREQGDVEN